MKQTLTLILCIVLCSKLEAQQLGWQWAKASDNDGLAMTEAVAIAPDGGVLTAGNFNSSYTAGNITLHAGTGTDGFVCRYDRDGQLAWMRQIKGQGAIHCKAAVVDPSNGDLFIAGSFDNTIVFDTVTYSTPGITDAFLAKYDAAGRMIWARTFGIPAGRSIRSLHLSKRRELLIGGAFTSKYSASPDVSFGQLRLTGDSWERIFLLRADTGGNVTWAKAIGMRGSPSLSGLGSDPDGNLYFYGQFTSGGMEIDSFLLESISTFNLTVNIFIAKLDTTGRLEWAKAIGGVGPAGYSFGSMSEPVGVVDHLGNVTLTSNYDMNVSRIIFEKESIVGSISNSGAWFARFDPTGRRVWAAGMNTHTQFMDADSLGNVYLVGSVMDRNRFKMDWTIPPGPKGIWMYFAKLGSGTSPEWMRGVGEGPVNVLPKSIAVTKENEIAFGGFFSGLPYLGFDRILCENKSAQGASFIARFGAKTAVSAASHSTGNIDIFPNPARSELRLVQAAAGNYQRYALFNTLGQQVANGRLGTDVRQSLQLPQLAAGVYYLELSGKAGAVQKAVSIQP